MALTPTSEQLDIIAAAQNTEDNLLVRALAGAAKTTTLVMLAEALRSTSMLCLAFNKAIQLTMEERLPDNCVSKTMNGLGHKVLMEMLGIRLTLEKDKVYKIIQSLIGGLPSHEKSMAWDMFPELKKAIEQGKTAGYLPTGKFPNAKRLLDDDQFFATLDEDPSDLMQRLIREATIISVNQSMKGLIDFNDQILIPTLFPAIFDPYPVILIDEAQDLNPLQHAMLRKLVKKRLMGVGDEHQAIYAFRGAANNSMDLLQSTFSMSELRLSTSFRCPKAVVREARLHAPHMNWPEWAVEGMVTDRPKWTQENIPEDSAIICRNNAPLFSTAIKLLKNSRHCKIMGNDIGAGLIKIMKKFGPLSTSQRDVFDAIDAWEQAKLGASRDPGKITDQAACMRVFAEQGASLGDAIAYAEAIFKSEGPVRLMTIHKSKGLEFDNVFLLDRHLIRRGEGQEDNLLYVATTRAKQSLTYITSEGFNE